ncbi:lamin tail domain-containing protein [Archangium violaceum]|uniref:lamin tail domain-containing protein n=1 Tax=Archangium violaceum TaxID=83451 RepID=UPI00193C5AEF|nr:DUF4215 domain-containing protein [Archangium violaceum]QRK12485.1 lamin tail domain-containing protein [Archangium violaceum]
MRNNPRHLLALLSTGLLLLTACPGTEPAVCGDGRVEGKEQCDDGNTADGDSCSSQCTTTTPPGDAICGNGQVEVGELCDDGNTVNGDGCQNNCVPTPPGQEILHECGNGIREIGEACDDGNKDDGDECTSTCTLPPAPMEQCPGAASLPQPEAGATCTVIPASTANGARLYMGVVLMDGKTLNGGQVLVNAEGTITCAACDCSGEAEAAGAERISCPAGVISPGLINANDRISVQLTPETGSLERYEHRYDWDRGNDGHTALTTPRDATEDVVRWGELRQVMAGTTSLAGNGGRTGLLRELAASQWSTSFSQEGLREPSLTFERAPLGDSSGKELTSGCDYPSIKTPDDIPALAAYLANVAEGIEESAHNEFRCVSGQGEDSEDLLTSRTAVLHGMALTAAEISKLAERGTSLVWSPRANVSLYGDTSMVTAYKQLGVNIALGTHRLQLGSMNLLRELQCANYLNQTHYSQAFTDEELWRMVTANAADATETWEKVGRIAKGKVADLAIYRLNSFAKSPHRAVIAANPEDVVLTVRGGKPLYGDKAVVDALTVGAEKACEEVPVCGTTKAACVESETGKTFAVLKEANKTSYPLFFCADSQPTNEPTCEPQRTATTPPASVNGSNVYTGTRRLTDYDGDGIENAQDNCPIIFNPIRPMDNGKQADTDNDGLGDACDPCPLDAGSTTCSARNPTDADGDGIPVPVDNCPGVANPDQADMDGDGRGDVCDACRTADPDDVLCPVTIYDLKKPVEGKYPFRAYTVTIPSAIVTAVSGSSYFIQVDDETRAKGGVDWSGIFVYSSNRTPKVGQRIRVENAVLKLYYGQLELVNAFITVLDGDLIHEVPAPVSVIPDEVVTGGSRAEALEGVLVQLTDVVVTKQDAAYGEFFVNTKGSSTDGVYVDDFLYKVSPLPAVGTEFYRVRGVLTWRNNNSKLEPRNADDLLGPPPALVGFGPAGLFTRVDPACAPAGCSTLGGLLTVSVASPYPDDLEVVVASSNPGALEVANGGTVVIPKGQSSAEVKLIAKAQAASVTLTAQLGTVRLENTVRVLAANELPAPTALTPNPVVTAPGYDVTLTATLDIPAPAGTTLEVVVTPAEIGTVEPSTVAVGTDATTASFVFSANPAAPVTASGSISVRVSGGTSEVSTPVNFTDDFPKLISLTPSTATVVQGTIQKFTVTLNKVAEGDVAVKLAAASSPAGAAFGTVPATVVVPMGSDSATFDFTADAAGDIAGTVTAALGADTLTANVTVRTPYPMLASISPTNPRVVPGATQEFTVSLDKAAEAGGATISVSLEPATGLGSLGSSTVFIAEGSTSGTVTFTATTSTDGASGTFVATYDGTTLSTPVTVSGTRRGLVINEVDYDMPGAGDSEEFVEIYNSSSASISLADLALVFVNGNNNTEYLRADLASIGELGAGEYLVVGSAKLIAKVPVSPSVKTLAIKSSSNAETDIIQNGSPDGVAIYNKATDSIVDSLAYEGDMQDCTLKETTTTFDLMEGTTPTTSLADSSSAGSLSRIPNAQDSDSNMDDFKLTAAPTPGAPNAP